VEVHAHPILDDEGKVSRMIEYTLDITKRKRSEEALRESEMKLRSVTESAKDSIISADKNGTITPYIDFYQIELSLGDIATGKNPFSH
jgi:PAS domain-containing protein